MTESKVSFCSRILHSP